MNIGWVEGINTILLIGQTITNCGRDILVGLAVLVKYLPTMKLQASRSVLGMRGSRP